MIPRHHAIGRDARLDASSARKSSARSARPATAVAPAGARLRARRLSLRPGSAAAALVAASGAIALREQAVPHCRLTAAVDAPRSTGAKPRPAAADAAAARQLPSRRRPPTARRSSMSIRTMPAAATASVVIRDPSAIGQNLRIAHLPDKALIEQTRDRPAADPRRRRPAAVRRLCAAMVGRARRARRHRHRRARRSQTGTQEAIEKLPPEVTLAFAPQGNSLGRWMQAARRRRPRDRHAGAARAVRLSRTSIPAATR